MTWWQALILGIVQGLGEFLPISSSGHLVLFQNIFGIVGDELLFDTVLHLGTLVAVFIVFWQDIVALIKKPFCRLTLMLIVATIPAVIAAVFFGDFIDRIFGGEFLGYGFLFTAIILLLTGTIRDTNKDTDVNNITMKQAIIMGIMQMVAIMPGVSRAGSTICAGLYAKGNREAVTKFSFLLSIPAILGSLVYQIKDLVNITQLEHISIPNIALGTVAAAIAGVLSLKLMVKLVRQGKLWLFGIYVGVLGLMVLLDQMVFNIFF